MKGWVYIISNQAMPGMIKIGYSAKDPRERAQELGTGAPFPYFVDYEILVENANLIERSSHQILSKVRAGKEWFKCDIQSAVTAIKAACIGETIYFENRFENSTEDEHAVEPIKNIQPDSTSNENSVESESSKLSSYIATDAAEISEDVPLDTIIAQAQQGQSDAQYSLGCKYDRGVGVGKNLEEAAKWFLKAAEQGHVLGCLAIGQAYLDGRGLSKNEKKSIPFFRVAVNEGNAEAQYQLAKLASAEVVTKAEADGRDREKMAFDLLKAAADQGHAKAQLELGVMHSLKCNYRTAFRLYHDAAEQGLAMAQRYLADCYLEGQGCKRDLELAETWFRKASDGKNQIAKKRLQNWKSLCAAYYPGDDDDQ